jgi:hypothetical protein
MAPTAVEVIRKLAGHWLDRELAVSLNRMRCKTNDGEAWTTVRVRGMRERLGIPDYDPAGSGTTRHLRGFRKKPRAETHTAGDANYAALAVAGPD